MRPALFQNAYRLSSRNAHIREIVAATFPVSQAHVHFGAFRGWRWTAVKLSGYQQNVIQNIFVDHS